MGACAGLAGGCAFLAGITGFFCCLSGKEIISLVIDCAIQNGSLGYAVISGTLKEPESFYASSPTNAQILFTSAPLMVAWVVFFAIQWLIDAFKGKPSVQITSEQDTKPGEGFPMVQISLIKEAWTDQEVLRPLWV